MVLLKNDGILPLSADKTVFVTGNNAHIYKFGDYGGKPINTPVSPFDGIASIVGKNAVFSKRSLVLGGEGFEAVPGDFLCLDDGMPGVLGKYYNNAGRAGMPVERVDESLNFVWNDAMPDPIITTQQFAIFWQGNIIPPVSGEYRFKPVFGGTAKCEPAQLFIDGVDCSDEEAITLAEGEKVPFTLEYKKSGDSPHISLQWLIPANADESELLVTEVEAARNADYVVAVVGTGINYVREDEGDLSLSEEQQRMLEKLRAVNKNLIVVLYAGSPLAVPWVHENARAVIEACYPGEQGGGAIADILYGKVNPSGRFCQLSSRVSNDAVGRDLD